MPADRQPPPDGAATLGQRHTTDALVSNRHGRGNHCDAVALGGQGNNGLGGAAFQENARPDVRDVAGRVQPLTAHERPVEHQQWLLRQLGDIHRATATEPVVPRRHPNGIDGEQGPLPKGLIDDNRQHQLNVAIAEPGRQAIATVFHEMDLDAWVTLPVRAEEWRKGTLDNLRRGPHAKDPRLALFQRVRASWGGTFIPGRS
jgi:hypothetical protein